CRQNSDRPRTRRYRSVRGSVHSIQVFPHGGERFAVTMASYLLNQRNVANTETEKEPPRVGFSQGILSGGHRYRIAGIDTGNPCGITYGAVAPRSNAACVRDSRPTLSGNHIAPNPSCSSSAAASRTFAAG